MLTLDIVKRANDADKAHSEAARDLWNTRQSLNHSNISELEKTIILTIKKQALSAATKERELAHAAYDRAKAIGISSEVSLIIGTSINVDNIDHKQMAARIELLSGNSEMSRIARSLIDGTFNPNPKPYWDKSNDPNYEYDAESDRYILKKKEE